MNIFDQVLQSIDIYGIADGYVSEHVDGTGARCLNGHVAGCHGFLGVDQYVNAGDDYDYFLHHLVDDVGNIERAWLNGASEAEVESANQYFAECQQLARIIVEQYEDVFEKMLEEHNNRSLNAPPNPWHKTVEYWWSLFGCDSAEGAIMGCPHEVIATFNDRYDVTNGDIVRVVEKARAQG